MTAAATNGSVRPARLPGIAGAPALWLGAACFLVHLYVDSALRRVSATSSISSSCGLHPALGYVDQPPLVPLIAAASFKLFGTALTPLRVPPALAIAATVTLTVQFARRAWRRGVRAGGSRACAACWRLLGQWLIFAAATDCLQPLTWLCRRLLSRARRRGAKAGGSPSAPSWASASGANILSSFIWPRLRPAWSRRRCDAAWRALGPRRGRRWRWRSRCLIPVAGAHDFRFSARRADAGGKAVGRSPVGFLLQQLLFVGPVSAPVWLAGRGGSACDRPIRSPRAGDRLCRTAGAVPVRQRQSLLSRRPIQRCSPPAASSGTRGARPDRGGIALRRRRA